MTRIAIAIAVTLREFRVHHKSDKHFTKLYPFVNQPRRGPSYAV